MLVALGSDLFRTYPIHRSQPEGRRRFSKHGPLREDRNDYYRRIPGVGISGVTAQKRLKIGARSMSVWFSHSNCNSKELHTRNDLTGGCSVPVGEPEYRMLFASTRAILKADVDKEPVNGFGGAAFPPGQKELCNEQG